MITKDGDKGDDKKLKDQSKNTQDRLGWMHKLIKEHILETLGWLK